MGEIKIHDKDLIQQIRLVCDELPTEKCSLLTFDIVLHYVFRVRFGSIIGKYSQRTDFGLHQQYPQICWLSISRKRSLLMRLDLLEPNLA